MLCEFYFRVDDIFDKTLEKLETPITLSMNGLKEDPPR